MHLVGFIIRIYHDAWSPEYIYKKKGCLVTQSTKKVKNKILRTKTMQQIPVYFMHKQNFIFRKGTGAEGTMERKQQGPRIL